MKRFGRISELFKLIFRDAASNEEIEIVPNSSTTYTATTTVELPEDDSTTQELVGVSANQTLDNKTIDATAATGTNTLAADATDIVYDPSGESLTAVDVQDALDEVAVRLDNVEADAGGAQQDIDDHIAETTGAHAATAISYDDSASSITAANIQEAVDAVDADAQQALSDAADAAQDAADVASDLSDHETESTGAHAATAISYDPTTASITSTEVQGAIDELDSDIADVASDLSDHETESTGAHAATAISYDNSVSGFPGTTEVQGALDATYTVFDNFANTTQSHINASSGVHGVTGSVVGTTDTQTLSGKTLDDPKIITRADLENQAALRLREQSGNGTNYLELSAPDAVTTNTTLKLPDGAGSSGQVLSTDGTSQLSWVSPLTNPMTTAGDIILGGASGSATRLGVGTANQILRSNGTTLAYTDGAATSTVRGLAFQSEYTSYTPTFQGFGTVTNIRIQWRRDGNDVVLTGGFTAGTPTATEARMSLPSGLTTIIGSPHPDSQYIVGMLYGSFGSSQNIFSFLASSASTSNLLMGVFQNGTVGPNTARQGSQISGTGNNFFFNNVRVPVTGW
jgi:hypothetical protein